jgi:exportin-5
MCTWCVLCWQVLVDASKEAATAVMPHLESLATRIQQMWEQGLLRQGEKVALYEGLMIAAAAGGAPLQAQLMNWLLQPLHDVWRSEAFLATLASPEAFAREYMAYEVVPDGSVVVGSRWVRRPM